MSCADSQLDERLNGLAKAGVELAQVDREPLRLVAVAVGAGDDLRAQLEAGLERLRRGSGREALAAHGLDLGFRLEDLVPRAEATLVLTIGFGVGGALLRP